MAQIRKMDAQVEVKSQADKLYDIFKGKAYLMPKICPDKILNLEILQGDWNSVGAVKLWTFLPGTSESLKEEVEAIDERNRSITFRVIDGEILKYYDSFKSSVQVTSLGAKGSLVTWSVEFVKSDARIPDPDKYLQFCAVVAKDIDAYLLKNA
uniref:Bet v I/Major latex protein domain-containing protein n=1 Tax=Kalanchoe fedtschenkoi TaxID=63787 RepID=A0A7N0UEX8_KALFE